MRLPITLRATAVLIICAQQIAIAQEFIAPDRVDLRHDLLQLIDSGSVSIPVQAWPLSHADVAQALNAVNAASTNDEALLAALRLQELATEREGWSFSNQVFIGNEPLAIRRFTNTPRADSGLTLGVRYSSSRFSATVQANVLLNPLDADESNLDGTSIAATAGNWVLRAGWQERWWGPGWNSSLILSTNARPSPGIALQRKTSKAFESQWLSWIGPWTVTTFMDVLDDDRDVEDALLWGARIGFVPINGLEIGLSRTAQWCGKNRPCSLGTFSDVLLGRDNRGVNVSVDDEPGNQLAGIDARWRLPHQWPFAFYLQWVGEDSRQGGPEIGSWLRQAGTEHWGDWRDSSYRINFEWADTTCREGGAGFSTVKPNCSYRHPIYSSGYNYEGRSLAHSAAGDSRALSLGATLVQSANQSWNVSIRYMQINRVGVPDPSHAITATRLDVKDIGLLHSRPTQWGRFEIALNYADSSSRGVDDSQLIGFLRWSSL